MTFILSWPGPPQNILIVHSYHQGFHWTDNEMAGMLAVLEKEALGAQIHVEYLDAKRYPPETFGPILIETLNRKTSRLKPKVILVSDDAAFDLMLSLRNELFPGVPLVFCGVNNFKDERLAGHMDVTGVVEEFDIKSTIDVILALHRQVTHLAVISDSTETGAINLERFRQVVPVFSDRLKFLELYDLSTEELLGKLAKLAPHSIILNLSFFRDRLGQSYSTQNGNIYPKWQQTDRRSCRACHIFLLGLLSRWRCRGWVYDQWTPAGGRRSLHGRTNTERNSSKRHPHHTHEPQYVHVRLQCDGKGAGPAHRTRKRDYPPRRLSENAFFPSSALFMKNNARR